MLKSRQPHATAQIMWIIAGIDAAVDVLFVILHRTGRGLGGRDVLTPRLRKLVLNAHVTGSARWLPFWPSLSPGPCGDNRSLTDDDRCPATTSTSQMSFLVSPGRSRQRVQSTYHALTSFLSCLFSQFDPRSNTNISRGPLRVKCGMRHWDLTFSL